MEDAATAEICRAQVWQWVRHATELPDGRVVTPSLVEGMMNENVEKLRHRLPERHLITAAGLYEEMITGDFPEFLTLRAYDYLD